MNGRRRWEWLVPLTGVAFIVLLVIGGAIQGDPKSADEPVNEIVDFYLDNKDSIIVGTVIGLAGMLLLLVFASYLRQALQAAAGESILPRLAYTGLVITAIGFAIDGTILIALAEAADDIEPTSVQTLQALWDNDFIPIALGLLTFLWSFGLAVVTTGVLPKWLGWIALLLGIVGLIPPIGFAAFIGTGLLILIVSIVLSMRARRGPATA
jgi:hypothetical protein